MSEDGTRLQRPSKETGSLADTGRHKWTPVFFSGERVTGREVEGRAHCSEVGAPELPPMKEARAEGLPFAQRGPQTQETVE